MEPRDTFLFFRRLPVVDQVGGVVTSVQYLMPIAVRKAFYGSERTVAESQEACSHGDTGFMSWVSLPSVLGLASWRACSPKTPQEQETPTGKVHGIVSGLGFILLLLTPLWAQGMPELAAVTTWNAAGFSIALFALILFLISGKRSGHHRGLTGLWQRLCLAAIYGGLLINGLAS